MSLLRGIQRSALDGGGAAAARGRLPPLSPSCLAGALRSRSSFLAFLFLFLLGGGGALRSRFSSSAYATTDQTPPDHRPERDAQHDLVGALRSRFFSSAYLTAAARPRFTTDSSGWEITGGISDAPGREMDPEAIELARFAVAEHNGKTNAALELVRLVKVRTQLVAGTMYYFTVEAREVDGGAGASKLYEAKVWLRPWEKFKGLDAFEPIANAD